MKAQTIQFHSELFARTTMRATHLFSTVRCCTIAVVAAASTVFWVYATDAPHNQVVSLGSDNFDKELNDPINPIWLLKFYAPWCSHCKHMAPILDRVASQVQGKMAIGKIDCTVHKKLCDQHKVSGYPTLKYSIHGEISDYKGTRHEKDLIQFANKMSSPAVSIVDSYQAAMAKITEEVEEVYTGKKEDHEQQQPQHEVLFVAYDPHVQSMGVYQHGPNHTTEQLLIQTELTKAFSKVSKKEQVNTNFAILSPAADCCASFQSNTDGANDSLDETPFVARLEENVPPRIWKPPASPADYVSSLHRFVTENYFPLVSQVGPSNFHRIGRHGRPLVLGVVHGLKSEQIETTKQQLMNFCLQGTEDLVSRYYFGWIDGYVWQSFLQQFEIKLDELPQVFVLDVPKKLYWQNATYSKEHGIQGLLEAIRDGKIPGKVSTGTGKPVARGVWGLVQAVERLFVENLPWSLLIFLSTCVAFAVLIVPPPEDMRPPYPKERNQKQPSQLPQQQEEPAVASPAEEESKKEK